MVNVRIDPTRLHFLAGPYVAMRLGTENDEDDYYKTFEAGTKTGWGVRGRISLLFQQTQREPPRRIYRSTCRPRLKQVHK